MNTKVLFSKESDHWSTPKAIYSYFMDRGYKDPCPLHCEENNLLKDFGNVDLYINPPYSDINSWVDYSISHVHKYFGTKIYLLVPSRTDTKWFQRLLQSDNLKVTFNFFEGRLKFGGSNNSAPFPSVLIEITEHWAAAKKINSIPKSKLKEL